MTETPTDTAPTDTSDDTIPASARLYVKPAVDVTVRRQIPPTFITRKRTRAHVVSAKVHDGYPPFDAICTCPPANVIPHQARPWPPLSEREIQIMDYIARGNSYEEIGMQCHITMDTVKSHMKRIFNKLGAKNSPHAVAIAIALHMVCPTLPGEGQ